ncbi:MAG: ATP-binding protein [Actinobacteria bacterium]|jgi:MoxR-like ATPase|nr:ATP-binding protein [Actinomycetota bacterium]
MTRDHLDYQALLDAVSACIATRIPFLLWGEPGAGKTAVVESASDAGFHVETLVCSHYEPSDFAGLPVVVEGRVDLAPPQWALRVSREERPSVVFFDEWTTASPAVQAAALRPLTHGEVGALRLPERVSFGAAANPADVAASGWELAAPTANRFVHLEWRLPPEVFTESLVTGTWPALRLRPPGPEYAAALARQRSLVASFLRIRAGQVSALPRDAASRGRAFPTPRTWDYTARLLAAVEGEDVRVRRLLVHGTVGDAVGHEFLAWLDSLDLPDPEDLLLHPSGGQLADLRADRVHASLQGVLAAVVADPSPDRWTSAVEVCVAACAGSGIDPAVPVVRSLLRIRPAGAGLPAGISVFAAPLALAGLLPR